VARSRMYRYTTFMVQNNFNNTMNWCSKREALAYLKSMLDKKVWVLADYYTGKVIAFGYMNLIYHSRSGKLVYWGKPEGFGARG